MISAAETSNKFQKTRFWKEKSVEDVVTLEPTAQARLLCIGWKSKSLTSFLFSKIIKPSLVFSHCLQVGNDLWSNIYFWKHFIVVESSNNVVEKCNPLIGRKPQILGFVINFVHNNGDLESIYLIAWTFFCIIRICKRLSASSLSDTSNFWVVVAVCWWFDGHRSFQSWGWFQYPPWRVRIWTRAFKSLLFQ